MCIKKLISKINVERIKKLQILSCCGMSFAHGAQDGLKFIGIMSIYTSIITGNKILENEIIIMLICALTMGLGVLIGGKRIVTTVGEKMVKLENNDAFCSDISTILTLITASLVGMPVSTTHVKTMAIASTSVEGDVHSDPQKQNMLNKNKFREIALTWGLTFPVCGLLAFSIMKVIT